MPIEPENWITAAQAVGWLITSILTGGATAIGIVLAQRRRLAAITSNTAAAAVASAAAAEQTVNGHADAEFPNLREELTAIRSSVAGTGRDVARMRDEVRANAAESRRDIGGMRAEIRGLHDDVRQIRAEAASDRAHMGAHIREHDNAIGGKDD